jgi:cytidyltransferase-like protein
MFTNVGIKSGCFTLIHAGHIWCIQECLKHCNHLILLTNSDEYLEAKKGAVPISLKDRLYILSNIKGVAEVSYFCEDTEDKWIRTFKMHQLYQEFGVDAQLTVFHSDELEGREWVPGQDVADRIIYIPKLTRNESVSKIYHVIKRDS